MALALDSRNATREADNSVTVAVTTGAISDAVVVVMVSGRGTASSFAASFNGSSMGSPVVTFTTATRVVQAYVLALGTISAGSKNAVVTGDVDTGWIAPAVYVLSGAHQASPVAASTTASNSGTSLSVTLNPAVAGCAYFDTVSGSSTAGPTMGAQTNRTEEWNNATPGTGAGAGSRLVTASGTSQTLNWTLGSGEDLHGAFVAIQPAAGGGGIVVPVFMNQYRQRGN